jgi:hypothetical protein
MTTFLNNVSSQPLVDTTMIDQEDLRHYRNSETLGPVFNEPLDASERSFLESFLLRHSDRIVNILETRGQVAQRITHGVDVSTATINAFT